MGAEGTRGRGKFTKTVLSNVDSEEEEEEEADLHKGEGKERRREKRGKEKGREGVGVPWTNIFGELSLSVILFIVVHNSQ